jgi:hypothetical protein
MRQPLRGRACAQLKGSLYMRYIDDLCQCRLMQQVVPALAEVRRISHININNYSKVTNCNKTTTCSPSCLNIDVKSASEARINYIAQNDIGQCARKFPQNNGDNINLFGFCNQKILVCHHWGTENDTEVYPIQVEWICSGK